MPFEGRIVDAGDGDRDIRVVVGGRLGKAGDEVRVLDPDARNGQVPVRVHERGLPRQPAQALERDPQRLGQLMSLRFRYARGCDPINRQPSISASTHDVLQHSPERRSPAIILGRAATPRAPEANLPVASASSTCQARGLSPVRGAPPKSEQTLLVARGAPP